MPEENSIFMKTSSRALGILTQLHSETAQAMYAYTVGRQQGANEMALSNAILAERLIGCYRVIPSLLGSPHARKNIEHIMQDEIPVEVGFTEDGWFSLRIPRLLPRKERGKGSVEYIRGFLGPAMQRFFKEESPVRFDDCVIIYRHIYDRAEPERRHRDDALGIQTEIDKARDKFLDLVESLKTGRYLTDKIQGVEKHSGLGEPRAVIFHGDYKVIIMASMIVDLPKDLRGQDPYEVYHYLLTKRLGSEIDYVVKGIDRNTGLAVGSRKDAMATKRRHYYLNQTRDGTYRIYEGLCCEARVMSVIPYGIFVDLFGIDVYIPLRELSYVRLTDAMGYYEPGDRVLVKVTQLNRDDPDDIRVAASVKQVAANPVDKALEKIEVNSNYAGTVTLTDSTGIFVRLDMGAECRCRFPYRARPPKGARVVVKIAGVDMEQKTVWGNITYVTIPK